MVGGLARPRERRNKLVQRGVGHSDLACHQSHLAVACWDYRQLLSREGASRDERGARLAVCAEQKKLKRTFVIRGFEHPLSSEILDIVNFRRLGRSAGRLPNRSLVEGRVRRV